LLVTPSLFSLPSQAHAGPYEQGTPGLRYPELLERPLPPYTEEGRQAGISGVVVLQVMVRKNGRVDSAKILRRIGYGLDESALKTVVTKWQFRPGILNGQPVDVGPVTVEVTFNLTHTLELPCSIVDNGKVIPKGRHFVTVSPEENPPSLFFVEPKITLRGERVVPTKEDQKALSEKGSPRLGAMKKDAKEVMVFFRYKMGEDNYRRVEFRADCE